MKTRFYNGKILTMQNDMSITNDEVWVDENKIVYIGKEKEHDFIFDREIDLNDNLLMPSFKNAHTHSAMTFLRSYADDLPLQEWLFNRVFPMEDKLTEENIYHLTKLAFLEYLTSGITACFDMYFYPKSVAKASTEINFRTVLCGAVSGDESNAERLESDYTAFKNYNEFVTYKLGFHAEYTTSLELMKEVARLAEKYKEPVFAHCSETENEVNGCIQKYGKTPPQLFDELGLWKYGGGGYHCVHTDDKDIEIFKKNNVYVVTNPSSNAKLASGIAPIKKYMDNDIKLAIGTDGPASNNCLDMFREMFLTTALQKIKENDASVVDGDDVLYMATVGGAKCMGLDDCDTIAVGKKADLIVIDLNQPNMQPINNITKNIVYSGSKQNVKLTMINGKILYEDNKFISIDTKEIYKKANEIINSMR